VRLKELITDNIGGSMLQQIKRAFFAPDNIFLEADFSGSKLFLILAARW
jgi:hypothetical protein